MINCSRFDDDDDDDDGDHNNNNNNACIGNTGDGTVF